MEHGKDGNFQLYNIYGKCDLFNHIDIVYSAQCFYDFEPC